MFLATEYFVIWIALVISFSNGILAANKKQTNNITGQMNEQNKYAPRFKRPSKMYTMDLKPAGSSIKLKCLSEGNPTPNITWYKNGGNIVRSYFQPYYGKWAMSLEELTKTDTGNYTCLVCNELGCINHTMALHVQERYPSKPYIKEGYPGNITAFVNNTVVWSCPTISDLEPYVYWVKVSNYTFKDTGSNGVDKQILEANIIESENPEDKPHQLTIYNVSKEDEGWYGCVALNTLGNTTAKGYLTVLDLANAESDSDDASYITINVRTVSIIATFIVLVLVVTILIGVMVYRRQRQVIVKYWIKKVTIDKPINDESDLKGGLQMPIVKIEKQKLKQMGIKDNNYTMMSEYQMPVDNRWEILRSNMYLTRKVLGEGEFGKVVKAECKNLMDSDSKIMVAVKMLKDGHSDADMIALVSELEIMKMIGKHENIINLLGCCTQDGPLYVIVEYARNGCLRSYLKNNKANKKTSPYDNLMNKKLTEDDLIDFTLQVARGMEYLASRGCIHRDLAARNVLVSDRRVLKIADFGLARDVRDTDYYRKKTAGKLPARWMAPESLSQCMYTKQSDVWSFGVLTWEIMTVGNTPYSNVPFQYLYYYLKTGNRLEKPVGCSLEIYSMMKHCWSFEPEDRPSFKDLVNSLKKIIDSNYEV